jgi:spore germination cell wall hydrolase CwlJ-like protein
MTLEQLKAKLSDEQTLALTIWAEARAEPIEGEVAVGCVIRNRMLKGGYGEGWKGVCLKPLQFSCWNPGTDRNHQMLVQLAGLCLAGERTWPAQQSWLAKGLMNSAIEDRVSGANHYYSPLGMIPKNAVPRWAQGKVPVTVIGNHIFYRL